MGKGKRKRPARLGEKVVTVREALGLSQNEIIRHLGLADELTQAEISAYERNVREPSLDTLLAYANAAGVWIDVLVDDNVDLPAKLPCSPKHQGVRRKSANRKTQSAK